MHDHSSTIRSNVNRAAELGRLRAEIAELSAHLDAATAHLLDLIREFNDPVARRRREAGTGT